MREKAGKKERSRKRQKNPGQCERKQEETGEAKKNVREKAGKCEQKNANDSRNMRMTEENVNEGGKCECRRECE